MAWTKLIYENCFLTVVVVFLFFLASCNRNDSFLELKKKNKFLTDKIDSLETIMNCSSYGPSIFDAQCGESFEGDTISFDVGLLYNRLGLIHEIHLNLMKLNERTGKLESINRFVKKPNFSLDKSNYLETVTLNNLSSGYYLFKGYIFFDGKKVDIQRDFIVKKRTNVR